VLSVYREHGVVPKDSREDNFNKTPQDLSLYKRVGKGDLVVNKMKAWQGSLGVSDHDGAVSGDYLVCRVTSSEVDRRYLHQLLRSAPMIDQYRRRSTGIRPSQWRLYWDDFCDIEIELPPLAEQQAIADYLDAETARIDALIAKKRQLTQLLDERRLRLALAGVVGELTHEGPVRQSDLAWAGAVPEHWKVALLRLVAQQGTGHTPSRSHPEWWIPEECVVPWVTTGEVQQVRSDRVRVIAETREKISHIGIANSSAQIHPKGTVFLCRTASAGYSGIMGSDMATSQDFATWTASELLDPEYLLFCLRAMRPDLIGRLATGSTHKTIYMPDIQALKIPVPPVAEQQEIAALLKREIDRSFAVDDALSTQVSLLAERRQALMTAAVSGEFAMSGAA
jgi:type I restriction enzyme, S subunit